MWTKLADASLMEVASSKSVSFAASIERRIHLARLPPGYDALATLAKILDLLAATGRSLSSVVQGLPRVHLAHESCRRRGSERAR